MNKRQLWKKIKKRGPILWDNTDLQIINSLQGALEVVDANEV